MEATLYTSGNGLIGDDERNLTMQQKSDLA